MRFRTKTSSVLGATSGTEQQIARAATLGMRKATEGLKQDLRTDVTKAGLGQRLANTWRGRAYPTSGESMSAAAFVYSNAPKLIDAFDRGVTIRSSKGFYLAIPTEAAGRGLRGRITPGEWERRTGQRLRFVYRRGRPSLLVAERQARAGKAGTRFAKPSAKTRTGLATVVVFILLPSAKLKKRLDLQRTADRWADRVPGLVAEGWT